MLSVNQVVSLFFLVFFVVLLAWLMRPLASRIGLVDRPGGRKAHDRPTPLVGGLAVFLTFVLGVLWFGVEPDHWWPLAVAGALLVLVGLIDDLRELSAGHRFLAQIAAAVVIFEYGRCGLTELGMLVDDERIELGSLALPFTVFCVVGVINATNMLDGLDGLAGGLMLTFFGILYLLASQAGLVQDSLVLLVICAALAGFLVLNFRFREQRPARIFMGDAGSLFLGLAASWFLMRFTQPPVDLISPITAVWLFALPLLDTVSIMIRRVMRGRSPFAPDRQHFHHILLLAGFSVRTTVLIMLGLSLLLAGVGLYGEYAGVPQFVMFYLFLGLFALYFWGMLRAWKVMKVLHRLHETGQPAATVPKRSADA